jgi:deazaflavin-dependent oxidoreductase (nitroreductase family)
MLTQLIDSSLEAQFFRTLNRIVEPTVRAGWGSPPLLAGGLIVLETRGRRTGQLSRVPLAALRLSNHVLVSTYRGHRSNWVKNLRANPSVRYWLGGRPRSATAVAVTTPDHPFSHEQWPASLRWMLPILGSYVCAGWAFALLGAEDAPE